MKVMGKLILESLAFFLVYVAVYYLYYGVFKHMMLGYSMDGVSLSEAITLGLCLTVARLVWAVVFPKHDRDTP